MFSRYYVSDLVAEPKIPTVFFNIKRLIGELKAQDDIGAFELEEYEVEGFDGIVLSLRLPNTYSEDFIHYEIFLNKQGKPVKILVNEWYWLLTATQLFNSLDKIRKHLRRWKKYKTWIYAQRSTDLAEDAAIREQEEMRELFRKAAVLMP